MSGGHQCHALACETSVPPRLHMCLRHWRMVPKSLQRRLWAEYRPGQERTLTPSAAYLRTAAACVEAVARTEGQPEDAIASEVAAYEAWAEMVDAAPAAPAPEGEAP